jgi:CO/xanthine dehydrogenase FAD-binding subunit
MTLRKLPEFDYLEAKTIKEACFLLSKNKGEAKLIAGGTDLLISMRKRTISPKCIVNVKTIPNLDYIHDSGQGLAMGALATLHDIASSPVIRNKFPMIAEAAQQIGTPQVRNKGTIGGNLCNAAPSADMAPPLIALGARAKIEGPQGIRVVELENFFVGPSETVLHDNEMLVELQVSNPSAYTNGVYLKLPARNGVDIAVAGVAAVITLDSKYVKVLDAKIVLGAVAPTPLRAYQAENVIRGKNIIGELIEKAAQLAASEAKPISDIRGSANFRREMVKVLTSQAIRRAINSQSWSAYYPTQ